jgi:hypothetical protein
MELKKLAEANPWWQDGKVPDGLKGKTRADYSILLKSIAIREVTIITGVRRSGKSTLMYQMADHLLKNGVKPEQILFVNLEDNKLAGDALDDIYSSYREGLNPDKKAYIFLDEIHRREKWESWVRRHYDLDSNCKFVISGSCSYLLKKEYSTLLTGRNLTFEVFPLSFREFLSFRNISADTAKLRKGIILDKTKHSVINALKEYLNFGGFPDIFFRENEFKTRLLAQYFEDILYKDIVDRHGSNSRKTKDLALYLITNITGLISLRNLRGSLGLSYESIKDYLSYYKEAFLFFTVDHFSYSLREQKTNPSKVYCIDNGLRNAVSFRFSEDEGKLAENLVFLELRRSGGDVYYWKDKREVDFIVKNRDQTLSAINVSHTDDINPRELESLQEFKKKFGKTKEMLVITRDVEKKEKGINYIPLWKWLLTNKP